MYSGEPVTQLEHALQTAQAAEKRGRRRRADHRSAAARSRPPAQRPGRDADRARHRRRSSVFCAAVPASAVRRRRARADPAARRRQALSLRDAARLPRCALGRLRGAASRSRAAPHSPAEAQAFIALPGASAAVRLRRWDDAAKSAGACDAAARALRADHGGAARRVNEDPAQPARRRRAARLGDAHRPHRHPAHLGRRPAALPARERIEPLRRLCRRAWAITALIQSSNATALMVASFAGQGLIATAPALAVMLGADVGTALMTLVFSFDLSWLSPLLIFVGVTLFMTARVDQSWAGFGHILIGLGLIILALQLIVLAARPLTQAAGVKVIFASLTGDVLLDMLVGRDIHHALLFEPRRRAADRDAGDVEGDRAARGDGPGPGRESRQRPARDAQHDDLAARGAARQPGQPAVPAHRLRDHRSAAALHRGTVRVDFARRGPDRGLLSTCCSTSPSRSASFSSPKRSRTWPNACCPPSPMPTIRPRRAISTRPRSTRRRWRSATPRARRCASATSSSRC